MIASRIVQPRRLQVPLQRSASIPQPSLSTALRPLSTFSARQNAAPSPLSSSSDASPAPPSKSPALDPRWLTMTKRRIGKCLMFGLKPHQVEEAGQILQELARHWRELIAGSEGFLTDETRRGLFRHNVVWGEMDVMLRNELTMIQGILPYTGHVNNVTYVRYAETARINFMRNYAIHIDPAHKKEWMNMVNSTGIGLILRSIKVDYKFPMKWPDKITVYQKLVHDPSSFPSDQSAFELHVIILSEARQRPAARCHEEIVTYDYRVARKTPLPPFVTEQFKKMWALQEEAKATWRQRIQDIESRVRKLEVESWDREDAVEDMGSAAGR